ncbi:MAG: efflux RND transporter permease subunit [Acidobacteriota bacterium]|nr:efflux RND transporter permease subunit [Acidobacteriota bacterium]
MRLARTAIDRPVTTMMFYIGVILIGFVSLRQLSVDLLPDISYPRLSVLTRFPGVAPEEIETMVTAPLEAAVSRVPGLRKVESLSREGVSFLTLEFVWGTDMDFAMLHTRERLDAARYGLPEGAETPTLIALDPQTRPIMVAAVSGRASLLELKEFSEELVKPRLEQLDGIGSAEVVGGAVREIHVEADPGLLSLYGLTIDQVASRIDAFNRNLQGGTILKGRFSYALRVIGEFAHAGELGDIPLATTPGRGVVRLRDVARVEDSVKEREGATRLNGKESVGLLIRKESGANTVAVTRTAKDTLNRITREYPQVEIFIVSEQARYIETAVASVKDEVLQGGLLAFLVLLIFLQHLRTALTIFAVIGISIMAVFNILFLRDITLNIMSLGGLALGVGMLDDCAIVVAENIFRHRSQGKSPADAAYVGTKEVGMAVSATIFTAIVVFLPVIYVRGVAGQLFRDTALTVTFSLLASLLVALTLIPMLLSRGTKTAASPLSAEDLAGEPAPAGGPKQPKSRGLLRIPAAVVRFVRRGLRLLFKGIGWLLSLLFGFVLQLVQLVLHYLTFPIRPLLRAVGRGFNSAYGRFASRYHVFLLWSLNHKARILGVSAVLFALTLILGAWIPRELMPRLRVSAFEVFLRTPVDYSYAQTEEFVGLAEGWLAADPAVEFFFSQIGLVSGMESFSPDVSLNSAKIAVQLDHSRNLNPAIERLRARFRDYPDIELSIVREQATMAQFLALGSAELGLKVRGDDLDVLKAVALDLAEELRGIPGVADVIAAVEEGKPEFLVRIRRQALEKYELSPEAVSTFLVNAVRGRTATQLKETDRKHDIVVRMERGTRESADRLLDQSLPYRKGSIPLRELVDWEIGRGPKEIRRENQQREIPVTANLRGTSLSRILPEVEARVRALDLPYGVRVVPSGEQEEMSRSFRSLITAFLLSVLLVYMIMAAQFESLLHPFLIMFTVPMGLVGAFGLLAATGQTLNIVSIIGIVVLVGIVNDNAIVKIDFTNQLRRSGLPLRQAVLEGSAVRLRPILMSTATTIFALIPLSLGLGEGSELLRPLGIAVVGGLLSSTFLTLILIPVIYEIVEGWKDRRRR